MKAAEDRGPRRFRTLLGKTSASPTRWGCSLLSVAALLAALNPQLTPDGAAPMALVEGKHQQAPYWAALVSLVPLGHGSG